MASMAVMVVRGAVREAMLGRAVKVRPGAVASVSSGLVGQCLAGWGKAVEVDSGAVMYGAVE